MEDVTGVTTSTYDSIQTAPGGSRKTTVTNPANKTITYAYDAAGVRSAMTDPDGGRFTYSYNSDGQLETLVNPQNDRTTYSYDAQGRRDSMLLSFLFFFIF